MVITVTVAWEGSLLMQHCGSEGPDVIRDSKGRERRQAEMNGWPGQRHGVHQRGSKGLGGARGPGQCMCWQMGKSYIGHEQACVGHSQW